ncbi:SMP-30/gluconolactonase/LRE family protein [Zavarzinia sp. CC-PAN008]|uniref:SMP-30/gluconolactonase/LRE family protein n=1 Tax=Zavarzinia sp. CC-PAN008 TaxID=3243332 RepID=UPI003F743C7B
MAVRHLASGLKFPEGPIAMPDGSVILVEIQSGNLTRVTAQGKVEVVAHVGGGPNGAALGPDNHVYITNNGGFEWVEHNGEVFTTGQPSAGYKGGSIQRVNLANGKVETLYTECDGVGLVGPNDLVFDAHGGFYFTDLGKVFGRQLALGTLYYAKADGSAITPLAFPLLTPNGTGLSPDGKTVYVAHTFSGFLLKWDITAPGVVTSASGGGDIVGKSAGAHRFDSLAVEADGRISVATLGNPKGGISTFTPDGALDFIEYDDSHVTNICFGGKDMKTAFITLSGHGNLIAVDWPRPGLKLAYQEV